MTMLWRGRKGESPRPMDGRSPSSTTWLRGCISGGVPWEVVGLRWEQHRRMTSSDTYALLREAAEATGIWDSERSSARSVLEAEDLGGLVDVLLADREPEAAWMVTDDHQDWDPGRRRWKRLAESRESSHPADAMAVYFRLADFELETTGRIFLHPVGDVAQEGTACGRRCRPPRGVLRTCGCTTGAIP